MTMVREWFNRNGCIDMLLWVLFLIGAGLLLFAVCYQKEVKYLKEETMLGILEIPKLEIALPIYEGTAERVLQEGVGHLSQSADLGAGKGTLCLLAGHRGLPNQELLARLGEMQVGDVFYVFREVRYAYRVCDIRVVRPEETEGFVCVADKELVSLITCTPYGLNTHRLIVTGERME